MNTLPDNIKSMIYQYDNTYRDKFNTVMDELTNRIVVFKISRNKTIADNLKLKHFKNIWYCDDYLKCQFNFPLYETPNDFDEDEPNTITTMNCKYCAFINDIQMGSPFWYKIENALRKQNINCVD